MQAVRCWNSRELHRPLVDLKLVAASLCCGRATATLGGCARQPGQADLHATPQRATFTAVLRTRGARRSGDASTNWRPWPAVTCDAAQGSVLALNLSAKGLSGTLPSLGALVSLREL